MFSGGSKENTGNERVTIDYDLSSFLKPFHDGGANLRSKSMDWFLYDIGLRQERVKQLRMRVDSEFSTC